MALHLDISESVAGSLRLPVQEIEPRLRAELALALYAQCILPFWKASELAAVSRYQLAELLGQRAIARHYADDELAQDLDYARGQ